MSDRRLRVGLAAGAVVGMGIAAYLTVLHLSGGTPICATGGCETVQRSRYAELLGVPVAALGLALYAGLLASTMTRAQAILASAVALSLAAVIFAVYLVYVQLAVLHAVCTWCVASDALTMILALVAVARLRRSVS